MANSDWVSECYHVIKQTLRNYLLSIACSNSYVTVVILDIIRRLFFYVK
jgi:hypothetical protein